MWVLECVLEPFEAFQLPVGNIPKWEAGGGGMWTICRLLHSHISDIWLQLSSVPVAYPAPYDPSNQTSSSTNEPQTHVVPLAFAANLQSISVIHLLKDCEAFWINVIICVSLFSRVLSIYWNKIDVRAAQVEGTTIQLLLDNNNLKSWRFTVL